MRPRVSDKAYSPSCQEDAFSKTSMHDPAQYFTPAKSPTSWRFLQAGSCHTILWRCISCGILVGAQVASTYSYTSQMQRIPELRFSATLGEEPKIELALV